MAADRLSMLAATIAMIVVLLAWSAVSQDNGWLALDVEVVTKADAEKIGWKTPRGVRVKAVAPGSTAEEAGLKVGDIILSVDGVDILSIDGADIDQPTAFHRAVEAKAPGMRVNLTVYSNSRERQVVAYLEFPAPIVRGDATSIGVFPYIGARCATTTRGQEDTYVGAR
jgi:serine protease Do